MRAGSGKRIRDKGQQARDKKNLAFGSMTLKNNYFNSIRPLHNGQIILDVPPLWNSLPPGEKSFITLVGISNSLLHEEHVIIVSGLVFFFFFFPKHLELSPVSLL